VLRRASMAEQNLPHPRHDQAAMEGQVNDPR
jgi:hypothetical protein